MGEQLGNSSSRRRHPASASRVITVVAAIVALVASGAVGTTMALWSNHDTASVQAFRLQATSFSVQIGAGANARTPEITRIPMGGDKEAAVAMANQSSALRPTAAEYEQLAIQGFVNIPITVDMAAVGDRAIGLRVSMAARALGSIGEAWEPIWSISQVDDLGQCSPTNEVRHPAGYNTPSGTTDAGQAQVATSDANYGATPYILSQSSSAAAAKSTSYFCLRGILPTPPETCDQLTGHTDPVTGADLTCHHYDNTGTVTYAGADGKAGQPDSSTWTTDAAMPSFDWKAWAAKVSAMGPNDDSCPVGLDLTGVSMPRGSLAPQATPDFTPYAANIPKEAQS